MVINSDYIEIFKNEKKEISKENLKEKIDLHSKERKYTKTNIYPKEKIIVIRTQEIVKQIKYPLLTKIILRQKFKSWKNNIKYNNLIQTQISFYIKGYLGKKESLNLKKDMNLHKESNIKLTLSKPNKISEKKIEQFYYELIAPKKIEEITQTINEEYCIQSNKSLMISDKPILDPNEPNVIIDSKGKLRVLIPYQIDLRNEYEILRNKKLVNNGIENIQFEIINLKAKSSKNINYENKIINNQTLSLNYKLNKKVDKEINTEETYKKQNNIIVQESRIHIFDNKPILVDEETQYNKIKNKIIQETDFELLVIDKKKEKPIIINKKMNFNDIQPEMNESITFDKTLKKGKSNKININDDRKEKENFIKEKSKIIYKISEKENEKEIIRKEKEKIIKEKSKIIYKISEKENEIEIIGKEKEKFIKEKFKII